MRPRHLVPITLLAVSAVVLSATGQEQIRGTVDAVQPTELATDGGVDALASVEIRLDGDQHPSFGDTVRFQQEVPGVGPVVVDGEWAVVEVWRGMAAAIPAGAMTASFRDLRPPVEPAPGQTAVITSARPRSGDEVAATNALVESASAGDLQGVRSALAAGAAVNGFGREGVPALLLAAVGGHVEVVESLLESGADPLVIIDGLPLIAVVAFGDSPWGNREDLALQALLAAGTDPNARDKYDLTALHTAALGRDEWLNALQLMRAGAKLEARTAVGTPPQQERHGFGFVEDLSQTSGRFDRSSATPLVLAAVSGSPTTIAALLAYGADPKATSGAGQTPLDVARLEPVCEKCIELLENPQLALQVIDGLLHEMLRRTLRDAWSLEHLRWLKSLGVGLEDQGPADGNGLLHVLAEGPAEGLPLRQVVAQLVDAGADVDLRNWSDKTPLMVAAESGEIEVAAALLDQGADVNTRVSVEADDYRDGFTPLMAAAEQGRGAMVRFLLERGADRTLRTAGGQTAADIAGSWGHTSLAESLR